MTLRHPPASDVMALQHITMATTTSLALAWMLVAEFLSGKTSSMLTHNTLQPAYFRSLLSYQIPARSLCPSNINLLSVPRVHTTFVSRGFSVASLSINQSINLSKYRISFWYGTHSLRACSSHTFRRLLETHCIDQVFNSP